MPNAVLTAKNAPGVTSKLVAAYIREMCPFFKTITKEPEAAWGEQYNSANPGDTIYVKKPFRPLVGSTLDITSGIQDLKEEKVALTLDTLRTVGVKMNSLEAFYDRPISFWAKDFVEPTVASMAESIEQFALSKAILATANIVGSSGTQPGAVLGFAQSKQFIDENGCPQMSERYGIINPSTNSATVDARKGLFHKSDRIAEQYDSGYIATADGFNYMQSSVLPNITAGTNAANQTVSTPPAEGASTLVISGTTGQTITAGTVIYFAGVFEVHPLTKQSYNRLKPFVVTANATAASSAYTLTVSPAFYSATSGGLQNCSALPAGSAAVTFWQGTPTASAVHQQNLMFHPDAFRGVTAKLPVPGGVEFASSTSYEGINVRVVRQFDIRTSEHIMRFDILAGLAAVRPEWACRYAG
jgi:hypothetical protein